VALFGDIGKFFQQVVKNPVTQVVFPVAAVAQLGSLKILHDAPLAATHALSRFSTTQPAPNQDAHLNQTYPYAWLPQQYPQTQYYGGSPSWDSSMQSPVFSTPPAVFQPETSSAGPLGMDQWPPGFSQ
jgi:hypothetical protein